MSDGEGLTRLEVLKALTESFKGPLLLPDTGAEYDLRDGKDCGDGRVVEKVVRGRLEFSDTDPLPMISILEPPTTPEQMDPSEESLSVVTKLPLLIQGFIKDDEEQPTDPAYEFMRAVQRKLHEERIRSSGQIHSRGDNILGLGRHMDALLIGRGVVRPPEAMVSSTAFFWLNVTLKFAERY